MNNFMGSDLLLDPDRSSGQRRSAVWASLGSGGPCFGEERCHRSYPNRGATFPALFDFDRFPRRLAARFRGCPVFSVVIRSKSISSFLARSWRPPPDEGCERPLPASRWMESSAESIKVEETSARFVLLRG